MLGLGLGLGLGFCGLTLTLILTLTLTLALALTRPARIAERTPQRLMHRPIGPRLHGSMRTWLG